MELVGGYGDILITAMPIIINYVLRPNFFRGFGVFKIKRKGIDSERGGKTFKKNAALMNCRKPNPTVFLLFLSVSFKVL